MFIVGLALALGGYALAYYAIDIMSWSRSPVANQTRPAPLKYILGLPGMTTDTGAPFHPIFTIADIDRANAVYAMGGAGAGTQTGAAPSTTGAVPNQGAGIPGLPGGVGGLGGLNGGVFGGV